jgi:diguanylate cyclase (GGDEF)-like protein
MNSTQNVQSKASSAKRQKKTEPLSPAASQIVQAALRDDISLSDLSDMALGDPAFALRVLTYVNNPVLGIGRRIDSIQQAAMLLGLRGLRSLALSLVITHLAPETEGTEVLLANCLRRAIAAQYIAQRIQYPEPETCFTLGLFLDCGLLVSAKDDAKSAIVIGSSPACFRLIRERAVGFRMHPDLGAAVAKDHFLSEEFIEGILRHHGLTCPATPLVRVAWLAERVAAVFEGGYYAPARAAAEEALTYVGLDTKQLDEMLERIPQGVVELSTVFERYVGPQLEIETLQARAGESISTITEQYESLVSSLESLVRSKETIEMALRNANGRIEELTTTDPLTGLCNRQALQIALERDLSRTDRDASDLSILLIDIDGFKSVNDTWGHAIGDALLALIGRVILGTLRSGDVAGRFGGEEFLVILPNTNASGANIVAERIRAAVPNNALAGPQGPISVTCSIGLCHERGPGCRTIQELLLRRAEQALYAAKKSGRDCVVQAV